MELKRILARDAKAANEKAIAMYGPEVLVISSCQVRGQTELIVAVDIEPLIPEEAVQEQFVPSPAKPAFGQVLEETLVEQKKGASAQAKPADPQAAHEALRGREIVDMVRDELAALRKEFRLTQQMAMWQGGGWAPTLQPLRTALQEAPIPAALRALLMDGVQHLDSIEPALAEIRRHLTHAIPNASCEVAQQGIHVIAGASGAGKTLTVASTLGHEQVAVISYSDLRPGAWNQTQLLTAQSGVDCFRAANPAMLQLLLEELSSRTLILIDTPGVQMSERLKEIVQMAPQAQCHAVVTADASASTLQRLMQASATPWKSLIISKLDEASQPWALLQFLTEGQVGVSAISRSDRLSDWQRQFDAQELVDLAVANLHVSPTEAATADIQFAMARASARLAQLAAQETGGNP
jgi:flagellar biosynthesis GTPase FlhF